MQQKNIRNLNPVLKGLLRFLWAGPTHGADMGPFQNKGDREGTCSRYCFAKTCRTFYDFWPYGPTSVCKMLSFEQNWGPGVHFSRRSKSGACSLRFKCSSVFDYKHQDCREGIDLRHLGGATCKFLGQFTVDLVRTKNITISPPPYNKNQFFSTRLQHKNMKLKCRTLAAIAFCHWRSKS